MISDPHDHPDHIDETASALLDQQLEDNEHTFAQTDPLVRDRARTFASLRASLLDTSTDDQLEVTPAGGARSADRQIMAALDVFDQLFPAAGSPSATDTRLTAPAPSPVSAAAPPLATVSLEAHRARKARSRTMMAVLGVAAAIAVVVFGVSRFGEDDSKSLSSAQTTALPAIAGAAQTAPAKRSTNASSAVSEAAGGTTGAAAAGSQIPAPAAADGSATAAATSPIDQGSALPQLESTDQLVTYIEQAPSFTATSIAAASAGTTAGGAALPSSAAGTAAAATTAASATTAAASATTTAGTTAGTAGTRVVAVCDPSPSAVFIGTILWQGQRATVFATPAPDGSPHRVGTVYSATCAVLTLVDIPF